MATSDSPLNVPNVTLAVARGASSGGGGGTSPEPTLLYDGFESADMSAPNGPAPAKNTSGFTWGGNNRTSVVTRNGDGNVAVFNNGVIYNVNTTEGLDWSALNGDYSLRFRYPAAPSIDRAEQDFFLGDVYLELWMSFWLRVPFNFYHVGGLDEKNHKIFRLWQDDYNTIPEKIGMEFRGDGNGNSNFYIYPGSGSGSAIGNGGNAPFIDRSTDLGRWMNLVIHTKIESSPGASDGFVKVWRKWQDEQTHTKTHERLNMDLPRSTTPGKEGFTEGYLMGYHNGNYPEDTDWLIDDFKLSETSLLEE